MDIVINDDGVYREANYLDYAHESAGDLFNRIYATLIVGNFIQGGMEQIVSFSSKYRIDTNLQGVPLIVDKLTKEIGTYEEMLDAINLSEHELYTLFELLLTMIRIDDTEKGAD